MCLASSSSEWHINVKSQKSYISILREVNATFQGSHLIFTAMGGTSCFSNVGRVGGIKGQLVNLGSLQCLHQGMVIHETLHALGLFHHCVKNFDAYAK